MADTVCNKLAPAAKNFKLALGLAYHAYFPARPAATKTDRIMAGQNHNVLQRCALMILSCHDSVGSCVCKRIPLNLRANWNTAVQRSEAGTKNFSRKEEVEREWYTWFEPLINTVALARWKDALPTGKLFQQFVNRRSKPASR